MHWSQAPAARRVVAGGSIHQADTLESQPEIQNGTHTVLDWSGPHMPHEPCSELAKATQSREGAGCAGWDMLLMLVMNPHWERYAAGLL